MKSSYFDNLSVLEHIVVLTNDMGSNAGRQKAKKGLGNTRLPLGSE